jgi:hypothetical protein
MSKDQMNNDLWADLTFPVSIPPDIAGDEGKAWLCHLEEGRTIMKIRPEQDACICHWVVEAAWAHPAWHSYSLFCQHLRPMPDYDSPVKFHLEDATHELLLFALDPRKDRVELIKTGMVKGNWMQPANFAAQFIELDDDLARGRIRSTVQEIVDGKLSPDTDYRQMWIKRFGGNMVKHD